MLQYILASGIGRSEKDVITILSTTMFLQEYVYIYFIAWPNLRQQQSFNYSFEWQSHAIYKSVVSGTKKLGLLLVFEFQGKSSFHYFRRVLLDDWYESFLQQTLPESIVLRS